MKQSSGGASYSYDICLLHNSNNLTLATLDVSPTSNYTFLYHSKCELSRIAGGWLESSKGWDMKTGIRYPSPSGQKCGRSIFSCTMC